MSTEVMDALAALVNRIWSAAQGDPVLRAEIRALAQAVLSATDAPVPPPPAEAAALPSTELHSQMLEAAGATASWAEESTSRTAPAVPDPLHAGPATAAASDPEPTVPAAPLPRSEERQRPWLAPWIPTTNNDLPLIESRCRLKTEAARWATTRLRRLAEGGDFRTEIEPLDRDLIARAKALPDCFLWMSHSSAPSPKDRSLLEDVAGCYETLANTVALVRTSLEDIDSCREYFEPAINLLAEAQSALRLAIERMGGRPDSDQNRVFGWLRATTAEQQILVQRFMRIDDPADPTRWADIDARTDALDARLHQARKRERQRRKLLGKFRYVVKEITSASQPVTEELWQDLAAKVDEIVNMGVPASNLEIRELLLPIIDRMPQLPARPRGFQLVLREIDQFLATRPSAPDPTSAYTPTADVKKVARLLKGKTVVFIGGESRPEAKKSLENCFDLEELIWIETREHQSLEGFQPYVARPEVALVLVAIRWSSHSFGDVKEYCDQYGKPFVRLPGGYSPNQVAAQICVQCSARLQAATD